MKKEIKTCHCCGQTMMVYRRNIRLCMIRTLRKLWFAHKFNSIKVYELEHDAILSSDFTKLRHWGLLEDRGNNTWGITPRGVNFILGRIDLPKYVWIYDNKEQDAPADEINPRIFVWQIAPQEISKEIVLADAVQYPYTEEGQFSFL